MDTGVQFSFEAVGAGWKLQNRTDFESKVSPAEFERLKQELERKKSGNKANDTTGQPDANAPDTEELGFDISRLNALIYFTADGIIWGYAPDANLQPLGAGRENPNAGKNTNIYVYDRISNRIQPIRIGEGDDSEPAWSPARPRLLAFSRAEGEHRQIWRVEFSPDGEPNEQQLTRYGGENPVWIPDGSSILYENNGQLWMVSADGIENQPIRLNGKVVFGHAPYVLPFK